MDLQVPSPENTRAGGIERRSAALLLFTKSDRGWFLRSFFHFCHCPDWASLTRPGVRARVAWPWI